jgi:predicted NBD/HSP70 family sugar kinase
MKQKQLSNAKTNPQPNNAPSPLSSAIGIDLGDRWSRYCVVNSAGEVVTEDRVRTTPEGMERLFQEMPATRHRGGRALSVGEPATGELRAPGDRGQSAQGADDLRKRPQE